MKIKSGDQVLVLQGKDKGKKGNVEKIFGKKNQILVTGVNVYKKHAKKSGSVAGGIIEITKPLPVSKLTLICPKCNLPTKAGFVLHDGKKRRVCKKCKKEI
ncbi:MAG: 50S ribosomal protein L24 [Candidatus Woykebacteria bacterium]